MDGWMDGWRDGWAMCRKKGSVVGCLFACSFWASQLALQPCIDGNVRTRERARPACHPSRTYVHTNVAPRYAALMVKKPKTGAGLVTWVWATYQIGSLIAASCIGPITDAFDPQILFWICLPFSVQILVPVMLGYLREDPQQSSSGSTRHSVLRVTDSGSTHSRRRSTRISTHRQHTPSTSASTAAVAASVATSDVEIGGGEEHKVDGGGDANESPQYEAAATAEEPAVVRVASAASSTNNDGGIDAINTAALVKSRSESNADGANDSEAEVDQEEDDEDEGPITTKCIFRAESCPGVSK